MLNYEILQNKFINIRALRSLFNVEHDLWDGVKAKTNNMKLKIKTYSFPFEG